MWANKVLRDYLVKGYSVNQSLLEKKNEKLKELQEAVRIIRDSVGTKELTNEESRGLLDIVADYSYTLDILDQYDYQTLRISDTTLGETYHLSYEEAIERIRNALVALTLMIAISKPEEKETMVSIIVNLINRRIIL